MPVVIRLATCVLLTLLAWRDVRMRRLPNAFTAAVAALYFLDAFASGAPLASLGSHLLTGTVAGGIAVAMFAAGWLGGGDVKLVAALFLWAGGKAALPLLVLISMAGLLVALTALAAGRIARAVPEHSLLGRAAGYWAVARGVPYGVALAAGGAVVILGPVLETLASRPLH